MGSGEICSSVARASSAIGDTGPEPTAGTATVRPEGISSFSDGPLLSVTSESGGGPRWLRAPWGRGSRCTSPGMEGSGELTSVRCSTAASMEAGMGKPAGRVVAPGCGAPLADGARAIVGGSRRGAPGGPPVFTRVRFSKSRSAGSAAGSEVLSMVRFSKSRSAGSAAGSEVLSMVRFSKSGSSAGAAARGRASPITVRPSGSGSEAPGAWPAEPSTMVLPRPRELSSWGWGGSTSMRAQPPRVSTSPALSRRCSLPFSM